MLLSSLFGCNDRIQQADTYRSEPIQVTVQVNDMTKAGYDESNLPETFMMDIHQGGATKYDYSLIQMKMIGSSNGYSSDYQLLWASDSRTGIDVKAMTLPYGADTIDPVNTIAISVNPDQSIERNLIDCDVLVATNDVDGGITISQDQVNITFGHLLSKFDVEYTIASSLQDSDIIIRSITLNNVCVQGGYSYANMSFDGSFPKDNGDIIMYHDAENCKFEAIFFPYVPSENPTLTIIAAIDGEDYILESPVAPKDNSGFMSGKKYNISIMLTNSAKQRLSSGIGYRCVTSEVNESL